MRITTWNVNGIRNPFGYAPWNTDRTFPAMFDILESDIVVMQELKIQRKDLRDDMVILDGWDCYFSLPKHKKGYSGVGIYTRNETCSPIKAEEGILGVLRPPGSTLCYRELPKDQSIGGYPKDVQIAELDVDPEELDSEGRCVCLEFPAFVLFGVYSPANSNGLRDNYRLAFTCALERRIRNLIEMGKRVILVGDLNVSRAEIDTAGAHEELKKVGMTHDQYITQPNRRIYNQMIVGGEVVGERDEGREEAVMNDIVRDFHPTRTGMYTHWEQKVNARPGNFGSRIDFVLVSSEMADWFSSANIQEGLMGSDHCPVFAQFKDTVLTKTSHGQMEERHILDLVNPPGYFENGRRIQPWSVKNIPSFSGKLLPEFDKRRSIKDMFKKPSMPKSTTSLHSFSETEVDTNTEDIGLSDHTSIASSIGGAQNGVHSPIKTVANSNGSLKRTNSSVVVPPNKKQKQSALAPKSDSQKGQQSLKGFFTAKASPKKTPVVAHSTQSTDEQLDDEIYRISPTRTSPHTKPTNTDSPTQSVSATTSRPRSPSPSLDGSVHDPIAAKDSWTQLMRRPAAPLCEHEEPCKVMLTKKKGEPRPPLSVPLPVPRPQMSPSLSDYGC